MPVIMLTVRGEEVDKVRGLNLGADDYVAKPFSLRELVLRMGNCLRALPALTVSECLGFVATKPFPFRRE